MQVYRATIFAILISAAPALSQTFDDTEVQSALCDIYELMLGGYGALLVMSAGISAIVAAAFGAYRLAISAMVTAIGLYILPDIVTLQFGVTPDCATHGGEPIDQTFLHAAVCDLLRLIEGSYGALLMTIAGVLAIASAAMGLYQAWYGVVVVGAGAFILRSLLSVYMPAYTTGFDGPGTYSGAGVDPFGGNPENCYVLQQTRIETIATIIAEGAAGPDGAIGAPVMTFATGPGGINVPVGVQFPGIVIGIGGGEGGAAIGIGTIPVTGGGEGRPVIPVGGGDAPVVAPVVIPTPPFCVGAC